MEIEIDTLKSLMPKGSRSNITPALVDKINNLCTDDGEDFANEYKDNFVSYISVLKNGGYRINDYMNAVKYVSYKLMEYSNINAYIMTFPDRYSRLREKYREQCETEEELRAKITNYVTAYNKNELVNKILEQTLIPTHVLNAPLYQQALNVQVDLMMHAGSEKVRSDAATSVMMATKAPESSKIELELGMSQETRETQTKMFDKMFEIASNQRKMLEAGHSLKDIQKVGITFNDDDELAEDAELL